ncbi:peptidase dimerization domain-containing protein [Streptomyces sp. L7]
MHGRAAHGSRPDLGITPSPSQAGHFLVAVEEVEAAASPPPKATRGSAPNRTTHSVIHGGEEPSAYPAQCRITLERRTVPGEDADTVHAELTAILDQLAATVPEASATSSRRGPAPRAVRGGSGPACRPPRCSTTRGPSSGTRPPCSPSRTGRIAPSWTGPGSPVRSSGPTAREPTRPSNGPTSPPCTG